MTNRFLQQVCEFLMTNVESMDIRTLTLPPLLASLVPHNFAGTIHPLPSSKQPPYSFLKTTTIPTYHGISIAIPRYIAMQLSTIPFIMTRIIIVILLCDDHHY